MSLARRGAVAGAAAAALWVAVDPLVSRALDTPYGDVRLLGRLVGGGRHWRLVGTVLHVANGAAFGAAFAAAGGRGAVPGVVAAELENAAFWPALAIIDRVHPDIRAGSWPRLLRNRRAFAHAFITHAVFGAALGARLRRRP